MVQSCITSASCPWNRTARRVSQLAIHAAKQAIAAGGWSAETLADPRTALVVGTSKGPIDEWLSRANQHVPRRVVSDPLTCNPFTFGLSELTTDIAYALKSGCGPRLTLACARALREFMRRFGPTIFWVRGHCDRVLVVAAESSLHPLFQATFKRLGVLADPADGCRPFDTNRSGFLLAEAAAAVCVETSDKPSGIRIGPMPTAPTRPI